MNHIEGKGNNQNRGILWKTGELQQKKNIKEYEEITDEANDIKPKEHVIIMRDFNAKLKVQRNDATNYRIEMEHS